MEIQLKFQWNTNGNPSEMGNQDEFSLKTKGNSFEIQLEFNKNFIKILMKIYFNPVKISMKYQFKFKRYSVAISMKYQWKSIGNPVKNPFEIKFEIEIGNKNSIGNELKF